MFEFNLAELLTTQSLIAFVTLAALEIVLGVDNIVFIAILTGKLDPKQQSRARKLGLLGAMVSRVALLFAIGWIMTLTQPLFSVPTFGILPDAPAHAALPHKDEHASSAPATASTAAAEDGDGRHAVTGKDLVLLFGGLFLVAKATYEIHHKLEGPSPDEQAAGRKFASFGAAIFQIMLVDLVFSLDSVITAVGMAKHIEIMVAAVIVAVGVMMIFADAISHFVGKHPTVKMLALAFLVLIGVMLIADGMGHHIPKGYIYFAMAFSLGVELLNLRVKKAKSTHASVTV